MILEIFQIGESQSLYPLLPMLHAQKGSPPPFVNSEGLGWALSGFPESLPERPLGRAAGAAWPPSTRNDTHCFRLRPCMLLAAFSGACKHSLHKWSCSTTAAGVAKHSWHWLPHGTQTVLALALRLSWGNVRRGEASPPWPVDWDGRHAPAW